MTNKLKHSDFILIHKYSLRLMASFPFLFIFLASGEALQHTYESFLGMFNGLEQFRHFQNDPARLSFGALKAFILLSALLTIPRVLFHFDKGYSALWLDKKALRKLINLFAYLLVLTVIGLVGVGIAFVVIEYFEKENIHSLFVVVFLMPFFIGSAYYEKFIAKDFGILWNAKNIPNLESSKSKGRTMSFYQVLLMGITAAPLIVFHLQLNKLAIGNTFFSPLILTFDSFLIAYLSITMGVATWLAYCRVYSDGLLLNDSYAKSTQPPKKISDLT